MYLIKNLYVENVSEKALQDALKACGERLTWYAYIVHDRDKKEDGEPKKSHYHLLMEWDVSDHHAKEHVTKALKPLYGGFESQLIIETVKSIHKQTRYLMHLDNKEKAPYNIDEVKTSDVEAYQTYIATSIKEKEMDKMLDDLLNECLERVERGEDVSPGWVLLFFKRLGRLDYYLKNGHKIYAMISEYIQVMTIKPF